MVNSPLMRPYFFGGVVFGGGGVPLGSHEFWALKNLGQV